MSTVVILADSRGRGLETLLCDFPRHSISVLVFPGAGLHRLKEYAVSYFERHQADQLYILAGICDITICDKKTKITTLRSTDSHTTLQNFDILAKSLLACIEDICPSLKIVLCPIIGIDLLRYNHQQGCSPSLSGNVHPPQKLLNDVVVEINRLVTSINERNRVVTPWLAREVHHRCKGRYRHYYQKLADGCHLTDDLRVTWSQVLIEAVDKNCGSKDM